MFSAGLVVCSQQAWWYVLSRPGGMFSAGLVVCSQVILVQRFKCLFLGFVFVVFSCMRLIYFIYVNDGVYGGSTKTPIIRKLPTLAVMLGTDTSRYL